MIKLKKLITIFALAGSLICTLSADDKLIINAKKFTSDDKKGISVFTGNVDMKRSKDILKSDKLVVYMTPKPKNNEKIDRKAEKFVATGNVDFLVYSKEKVYKGKGDKVIYDPKSSKYTIIGNGYLEEKNEGTKLYGDKIFLDEITGKANIEGSDKKPVKFIMNIESKK